MQTVVVKAAPGRRVLNHQRGFRPLLPEGEQVEMDPVWRKRIDEGDAVVVDAAPKKSKS